MNYFYPGNAFLEEYDEYKSAPGCDSEDCYPTRYFEYKDLSLWNYWRGSSILLVYPLWIVVALAVVIYNKSKGNKDFIGYDHWAYLALYPYYFSQRYVIDMAIRYICVAIWWGFMTTFGIIYLFFYGLFTWNTPSNEGNAPERKMA